LKPDRLFWNARYHSQVGWTGELRRYALSRCGLSKDARLLEVACSGGALLEALDVDGYAHLTGIDLDLPALHAIPGDIQKTCADGFRLPFTSGNFDACLSHFYLLWVADPLAALLEMKRVARQGGWLLALAEPDYGARVDQPQELKALGELQTQALRRRGADPYLGARLPELFRQAGLTSIESGVLARGAPDPSQEWRVLAADLESTLSPAELEHWRELDRAAWRSGRRVLHVPVHYAFGQIPA
jgi:SAM-dependent methyltransferase